MGRHDFIPLIERLLAIDTPIYYIANRGNWGDGLIRFATLQMFKDIGLNFKELKNLKKRRLLLPRLQGATIIYGGGGAWRSHQSLAFNAIKKIKSSNHIILPSTFEKNFPINPTNIYCRDYYSLEFMNGSSFCHDLAFYLSGKYKTTTPALSTGNFFREDAESSRKITIPEDNKDISLSGNHFSSGAEFIDRIAKYKEINTDRLHVAIAGAICGINVNLYEGNYFKNRAVYEASMKEYYPNIRFIK